MQHIAMLHHPDNRSRRMIGMRHLEHGLVEVVIELLALRADPADAMSLHGRLNFLPAHFEPGNQPVNGVCCARGLILRRRFQRKGQIVNGPDKITGKAGMTISARRLQLALGAPAHVFHISQRAKQLIFQRVPLGKQRIQRVFAPFGARFAGCFNAASPVRRICFGHVAGRGSSGGLGLVSSSHSMIASDWVRIAPASLSNVGTSPCGLMAR